MDKLKTYTSTGVKFMKHPGAIELCREQGMATPISLQIAPTSVCNLKCWFCSNANRTSHENLDPDELCELIRELSYRGLKTVEWSGGGEPTMYEHIRDMILFVKGLGLEQSMLTNGILLGESLSQNALDSLTWVRVSMNCLEYVDDIEIPDIKGVLGFSYMISGDTHKDSNLLMKIDSYVKKYKPSYVRMVPNCLDAKEQQEKNNVAYPKIVRQLGEPYFYQPKVFERPERCWWGYFKPFLLHDGYIYRCSSVVLNNDERLFHSKYRWVHMSEMVEELYGKEMTSFQTDDCPNCVFTAQNNLIDPLIHPCEMENWI